MSFSFNRAQLGALRLRFPRFPCGEDAGIYIYPYHGTVIQAPALHILFKVRLVSIFSAGIAPRLK